MSALIHALVLDGQGGATELKELEQIKQWDPTQGRLWLHLDYCEQGVEDYLAAMPLSEFAHQALVADETRPRIVNDVNGTLLFLRGVNLNPAQTPDDMVSIRLFVSEDLIVSTRHRRLLSVSALADCLRAGKGPENHSDLICELSENLTSRMQDVIYELEDKIDLFEEHVDDDKHHVSHSELSQVRRQTVGLKRYIRPQKEALRTLASTAPSWLEEQDKQRLNETINHLMRYLEELDLNIERAQIIQQELGSQVDEQLNKRMYVMSVVAALFLPLGFLTGLLGVNIGGMPGVDSDNAFMVFVVSLVVLTLAIAVYFRLKKWL